MISESSGTGPPPKLDGAIATLYGYAGTTLECAECCDDDDDEVVDCCCDSLLLLFASWSPSGADEEALGAISLGESRRGGGFEPPARLGVGELSTEAILGSEFDLCVREDWLGSIRGGGERAMASGRMRDPGSEGTFSSLSSFAESKERVTRSGRGGRGCPGGETGGTMREGIQDWNRSEGERKTPPTTIRAV